MLTPKHINFLLVDDYYSIRKAVKLTLRNLGFTGEIVESDSIIRARDILSLKESENKINFIISDLQMPEGSGIDFLKIVRSHPQIKGVPFLILSGVNDKNQILQAVSNGVSGYLFKPWDDETMGKKIDACWLKHA